MMTDNRQLHGQRPNLLPDGHRVRCEVAHAYVGTLPTLDVVLLFQDLSAIRDGDRGLSPPGFKLLKALESRRHSELVYGKR